MPETNPATWTEEELEAKVHDLLPEGSEIVLDDMGWNCAVQIVRGEEDDREVVWEAVAHGRQRALFEAYRHLWEPPEKNPDDPWAPSPRLPLRAAHRADLPPDPEDLDPKEVASVYSKDPDPSRR